MFDYKFYHLYMYIIRDKPKNCGFNVLKYLSTTGRNCSSVFDKF